MVIPSLQTESIPAHYQKKQIKNTSDSHAQTLQSKERQSTICFPCHSHNATAIKHVKTFLKF